MAEQDEIPGKILILSVLDDKSYLTAAGFSRSKHNNEIVKEIEYLIRARL